MGEKQKKIKDNNPFQRYREYLCKTTVWFNERERLAVCPFCKELHKRDIPLTFKRLSPQICSLCHNLIFPPPKVKTCLSCDRKFDTQDERYCPICRQRVYHHGKYAVEPEYVY